MFITIAQINSKIGNIFSNTVEVIKTIIDTPRTDIILFPEMVLLGYPAYDLLDRNDIKHELNISLKEILKVSKLKPDTTIILGSVRYHNNKMYNTQFVIKDGHIIHTQDKQCLPNYDVFQDKRHFSEGSWNGTFLINGKRCALFICEDIWANEFSPKIKNLYNINPIKRLKSEPVDLILCSSASPYEYAKHQKRFKLLESISKTYSVDLAFVNSVGAQDDVIFDGQV